MFTFKEFFLEAIKLTPSDPKINEYIKIVHSWGSPSPYSGREFIIDNCILDLRNHWNKAHISFISALEKNKKHGTNLMLRLIRLADEMSVTLSLNPDPVGKDSMHYKRLIEWYKTFGFVGNLSGMLREPNINVE